MQIAYGPPGQRGVTTLMAVGADELGAETPTEKAVRTGRWLALAIGIAGAVMKAPRARDVGLGAAGALFIIHACADRSTTVQVTTPAPGPSGAR